MFIWYFISWKSDPCLLWEQCVNFLWGVHKWKRASSLGWECQRSGWEGERQRCFRSSSTSKLPAVNQRSRLSPGAAPSSYPGGDGPPQGKKNTTKQMQRAAGQCVCMYVCVTFLHACGFLKLRMHASAYVFVCCMSLSEGEGCICVHVCVFLCVCVWETDLRGSRHLREGSSACISMSKQLCLFAPEPCTNTTTSSGPVLFKTFHNF